MLKINSLIVIVVTLFNISCGIYGYTSTNIPRLIPTISISNFANSADFFDPNIGLLIAETLQKSFQEDENYELIDKNADIIVKGTIIDYKIESSSLQSPNSTQINSLYVVVKINAKYKDYAERNINKKYKDFIEYDANSSFTEINDSLNLILSEKLADQIYYEMAVKW